MTTLTYLVTGGAGFIGSHLTDAVVADGHRLIVLDTHETMSREAIGDAAQRHVGGVSAP